MSIKGHLETLRTEYADVHRRFAKSKAELGAFELHLEELGIPKWEWPKQVLKCLIELKREWESHLKILLRLGNELKAFEGPVHKKTENDEKLPAKPTRIYTAPYRQSVNVQIVDGKTVTRFGYDAAHWIKANAWYMVTRFQRAFTFVDKQIPPEYAYVLEHNGLRYGPTDAIFIEYESDEFKRMCEREVETQSEHALDGERVGYWRLRENDPIGKVGDEH